MHQSDAVNNIWKNMMVYGCLFGALVGSMGFLLLAFLGDYGDSRVSILIFCFISIFSFGSGGICGGIFGLLTGIVSGLVMRWITKNYVNSITLFEYRVSVGLSTAWITTLMLLPIFYLATDFQEGIVRNNFLSMVVGSIVIAIYASQHTATLYLRDTSTHNKER